MEHKKKMIRTGYYADARSPIASSPMKRQRYNIDNNASIVSPTGKWAKRKLGACLDEVSDDLDETSRLTNWGGKVAGLFSPVLKYFVADDGNSHGVSQQHAKSVDTSLDSLDLENCLFAVPENIETVAEEESIEEEEEFDPYCFMKNLPAYNMVADPRRTVCLPKKTRQSPAISLVLDLDETLVHCCVDAIENPDMKFPVEFNGQQYEVHVRKRPHMDDFLRAVSKMFEVIIFTASQRVYAEKLLNLIDPDRKFVKYRLYRDACLPVDGNYLKDLNVLGRDLAQVVLIDNSPHAFGYQVNNGIPIESWFEDANDTELLKLLPFLESLRDVADVRPIVEKRFQTQRRVDSAASL